MASVALMSPPNQKEPDVLARASLLPKRKPIVPGVATRARFAKPRPNVITSTSNTPKESLPPLSENAKADDDVPSKPVEAESQTLQRPAIPKRAATIPVLSRARFQRAKPNIGSLMNKSTKDVQLSEKKCVPTSDNTKTQEASDAKLDVPDLSKTESTSEERYNNDCKSSPVARSPQKFLHEGANCSSADLVGTKLLLNVVKAVDMANSVAKSRQSPQPTIDLDSVCGNYQEFSSLRTMPEDNILESHTEKRSHSDVPVREPATEISSPRDTEMSLTSSRATYEVTPEKESPSTSAVMNKSTEYPTLKSILNSPRKKTATKKVHERRKRVANLSATPSRSEMTMVDLIYWNPSSSPMKEATVAPAVQDLLVPDDPPPSTEEPEDSNIGPKVIINDNGEIILDESSLFVRRKDYIDHSVAAVIENDNTTYSSFRNRTFKTWSKRETAKFYKALSLVGTDFALMENIFKEDGQVTRTRRELKLKFKREEKSNPKFVHTAMYELQTYDLNILDEDYNIELLDESELIDDAPKQTKRAVTSGTKAPGKRGRKKKSELIEATIDENTLDSICEVGEESREATDLLPNEVLQRIENDTEFNSKPSTSRPGRARKAKILSDYVTDVDDLSDTNDYLDNEGETMPLKKRKRIQVLSEEDDASTKAIDNNDSIIDDHHTLQEKITFAEDVYPGITGDVYPGITEEKDDNGKSGAVPIKNLRTLQMSPKINEENDETISSLSDFMPETSRSGRKIKAKKMSDFITDPNTLHESDDDMTPVEKMQDLDDGNIILCEENAENLNAVESVSQICDSSQLEGEFSVIPPADTDGEDPGEQNIICTLDVENPNGNNLVIDSSCVMDQNESNNSELISATGTISSSTEALSTEISSDKPMIDNVLKLPDSETCNGVNDNNIFTDPAITEVVVTSDLMPRRTRRKILPNVIKGSKRPPILKKPLPQPRRTSFISFTPVEEAPPPEPCPFVPSPFVQNTKTYSKPTYLKVIKSEEPGDMPEYLETVQKSPMNISRKRSLSGPAKSPCSPETNIARTNSLCFSTRSPLTNTPLNVFSFNSDIKPTVPQSSLELPLNTSVDPKAINMNPENLTDSPPVVFLTRTPNNSNMLHLFLYQKS